MGGFSSCLGFPVSHLAWVSLFTGASKPGSDCVSTHRGFNDSSTPMSGRFLKAEHSSTSPSQDELRGHEATYHKAGVFSMMSRFLSRASAKLLPTGKPWRASWMLGWKRRAQGSRPCRWCASS